MREVTCVLHLKVHSATKIPAKWVVDQMGHCHRAPKPDGAVLQCISLNTFLVDTAICFEVKKEWGAACFNASCKCSLCIHPYKRMAGCITVVRVYVLCIIHTQKSHQSCTLPHGSTFNDSVANGANIKLCSLQSKPQVLVRVNRHEMNFGIDVYGCADI